MAVKIQLDDSDDNRLLLIRHLESALLELSNFEFEEIQIRKINYNYYYNLFEKYNKTTPIDWSLTNKDKAILSLYLSVYENPRNWVSNYILGVINAKRKNLLQSKEFFQKVLKVKRTDADLFHQVAIHFNEEGFASFALENENKAIELDEGNAKYYLFRSLFYKTIEQYDESLKELDYFISLKGNSKTTIKLKAQLLFELKKYNESIKHYLFLVKQEPNNIDFKHALSHSYRDLEDYNNALLYLNQAIELTKTDASLFSCRGNINNLLKRHEDAINDCTIAIGLDAKCYKAYKNRRDAYAALGKADNALVDYDMCLVLEKIVNIRIKNQTLNT